MLERQRDTMELAAAAVDAWALVTGPLQLPDEWLQLGDGVWRVGQRVGAEEFVLKLVRRSGRAWDSDVSTQLELEESVLNHLAISGLRVAPPVRADDSRLFAPTADDQAYCTLTRWLPSERVAQDDDADSPSGQATADQLRDARRFHNCGGAIAHMHAALKSYCSGESLHSARSDNLRDSIDQQALPSLAKQPEGSHARLLLSMLREDAPAGAALAAGLAAIDATVQLVHRDCHFGNLLTSQTGAVVGVVDWDHLCVGSPAFDLAYFANQLGKWIAFRAASASSALQNEAHADLAQWELCVRYLMDGYREVGTKLGQELPEALATVGVMLVAPLSFAGWILAEAPELDASPDIALAVHIARDCERLQAKWSQPAVQQVCVAPASVTKYYVREHESGYTRLLASGLRAWDEMHGNPDGFEKFSSRSFLDSILFRLPAPAPTSFALELGCGTGPGACYMARRGWRVHGVDLVPTAVAQARRISAELQLTERVSYQVCDVAAPGAVISGPAEQYDLVLDSYCSQCIVLPRDRAAMFELIRNSLRPHGLLLMSCVQFNPARCAEHVPPIANICHTPSFVSE